MKLGITARVTLTHALLTACVLIPAGILVYSATVARARAERRKAAEVDVRAAAQELLGKMSKDILIEFDKGCRLDGMTLHPPDWALVRGDGTTVESAGIFSMLDAAELRESLETRVVPAASGERVLGLVPVPKIEGEPLPPVGTPLRTAIDRELEHGSFVRAKRASSHGSPVLEVSFVLENRLIEIELLEDGSLHDRDVEALPTALPADLIDLLDARGKRGPHRLIGWSARPGELLAIVEVERDRLLSPVAVNRFGEEYALASSSEPASSTRLWLVTALDASSVDATADFLLSSLALGLPVVWLASITIGWFVARRALSPVDRMLDSARRIDSSHLSERLPSSGVQDELGRLSGTLNEMLGRIEAGFERERRFTGDVSHELRGPLAKIIAEAELALRDSATTDERNRALAGCLSNARSLERIVESLLLLVRLDSGRWASHLEEIDIGDLAVSSLGGLDESARRRVTVELGASDTPVIVRGDARLLGLAIRNLLENALVHGRPDGAVLVRARRAADTATVSIEDEGPGLPAVDRERVFERFHRLDSARSPETGGAGLGLSLARSIARAHGGDVELLERRAVGIEARVTLPLAPRGDLADLGPPPSGRAEFGGAPSDAVS